MTKTNSSEVGQKNFLYQFQSWELNLATHVPGEYLFFPHDQSVFLVQLIFNCLCSCNKKDWEKSSPELLTAERLACSLGRWENGKYPHFSAVCSAKLYFFYQELTQFLGFHPHKTGKKEHILTPPNKQKPPTKPQTWASLLEILLPTHNDKSKVYCNFGPSVDFLSWWDSPHFCFSGKVPLIPCLLKTSHSRLCTSSA